MKFDKTEINKLERDFKRALEVIEDHSIIDNINVMCKWNGLHEPVYWYSDFQDIYKVMMNKLSKK